MLCMHIAWTPAYAYALIKTILLSWVYCAGEASLVANFACLSVKLTCQPSCPHLDRIHPGSRRAPPRYRLAHSSLFSFSWHQRLDLC